MWLRRVEFDRQGGKRRVSRRHRRASFGLRGRRESLDRAESVGGGRGRRDPRGLVVRFRLGERRDDRAAPFEPALPGHEFVKLARKRLEIELPAARGLVDPGAGFGQATLVDASHLRLPRDHGREEVVVEGNIGACGGGPDDHKRRQRHDRP